MQEAIEVLMIILFCLFALLEIIKLVKINRIEKKYVKSVKAIRRTNEVQPTIRFFEKCGWITLNVILTKIDGNNRLNDTYEITFIK